MQGLGRRRMTALRAGAILDENGRNWTCCGKGGTRRRARKERKRRLTGQGPRTNYVTAPEALR
jgi:hypothetical protein